MSFVSAFNKLPRVVQFILLLIPGVNWITEIVIRVSAVLNHKSTNAIIGLVLAIIPLTGVILGWVDLVWVLLKNELILS